MFEDAFAKHKHWHKLSYSRDQLEQAVEKGAIWAEGFIKDFAAYQSAKLPWMKP